MQMTVDDSCHLSAYGALNKQTLPRGGFKNNFYSTSDQILTVFWTRGRESFDVHKWEGNIIDMIKKRNKTKG